jgi:SAM-dependent methyltransferase
MRERRFKEQFRHFGEVSKTGSRRWLPQTKDLYPCLDDATASTGFDRHYIYHPAWAARVLAKTRPAVHVDVSSTLHFCSIVSAFVPVEFYDFRPAPLVLSGLISKAADVTQLQWASDSVSSLSCMHVIEHIGLGRYGDPVDPDGDLKAIAELVRVLKPGGDLLIAVPVGAPRICFNAHRIYDSQGFAAYFPGLELVEFSLIPDGEAPDGMLSSPAPAIVAMQRYGCGCFWFRKPLRT